MPDPEKILATVRRATTHFRQTPGRSGGLVTLEAPAADDLMVVGDLHGNVLAFRQALEVAALGRNPGRHLVLQELIHGNRLYPDDKGDKSHQLVDLVCGLKCQYPGRVHLILGNHELSELTGRAIAKNGIPLNELFRRGVDTAYGDRGADVYAAYQALFAALPLAVRTPNRVFLCHTIPDGYELDRFDPGVFALDSWPHDAMKRHGAVYCVTWGRDTAPETIDRFAGMVDADFFVTGHQPCEEGFRQANHRQIIIDGTDPYPAYCLFPVNTPVTVESLLGCVHILQTARP
jgi:Calcineurin-like phosphoesterase